MTTIRCMYTCNMCGLEKVAVEVPARGEEDVATWMKESCIPSIAADHFGRSPLCMNTQIDGLWIPVIGVQKVGGPSMQ